MLTGLDSIVLSVTASRESSPTPPPLAPEPAFPNSLLSLLASPLAELNASEPLQEVEPAVAPLVELPRALSPL